MLLDFYSFAYHYRNSYTLLETSVDDDRLAHEASRRARGHVALRREPRREQAALLLEAVELQMVG